MSYSTHERSSARDDSAVNEMTEQQLAAPALRLIICGAPASGKGTQCERIRERYGVVHLSTGDMLRAAVAVGTEVGCEAAAYMDKGALVPDDVIIDVVVERLSQPDCRSRGWLLDGFPRTAAQAAALSAAGIVPDGVLLLDVPDDALVERVVGRRLDPETRLDPVQTIGDSRLTQAAGIVRVQLPGRDLLRRDVRPRGRWLLTAPGHEYF